MTIAPVLAIPNFKQVFLVETNACQTGIGAVLMQGNRPIGFKQAQAPRQRRKYTYEKEFMSPLSAVDKWIYKRFS